MKNKQLLTYGLIALGIFLFTRKKEDTTDDGSNDQDQVLPGSDTANNNSKADPIVATGGAAANPGDFVANA